VPGPPSAIDRPRDPIAAASHPDPYPYYRELLARRPLYRDEALGLWVASSAGAVTAVLTSSRCRVRPPGEPVPRPLIGSAVGEIFGQLVRMNDGPGHAGLKPAVSQAVASFEAHRVGDETRRWAAHLAAELRPATELARLADFAFHLPVYVIASLLGVPDTRLPSTVEAVDRFVGALAPGATREAVERGAAAADRLLEAVGRGRDAMAANRVGFLSQAYEATAGLVGNTVVALARHPSARDAPLGTVVREVARYDAPVQNTRRFVAEPGDVGGQPMQDGDAILVVLAAANHDAGANPAPERFEVRRRERRVFTFGVGVHACPGETLASTIAELGVRQLLDAGLEPDAVLDGLRYRASANTRVPLFGAVG
jgi:cytochrome P450